MIWSQNFSLFFCQIKFAFCGPLEWTRFTIFGAQFKALYFLYQKLNLSHFFISTKKEVTFISFNYSSHLLYNLTSHLLSAFGSGSNIFLPWALYFHSCSHACAHVHSCSSSNSPFPSVANSLLFSVITLQIHFLLPNRKMLKHFAGFVKTFAGFHCNINLFSLHTNQ